MRVLLSDPTRLDELRTALREADCVSVPVSDNTLVVVHPLASDDGEAAVELSFFVKAWCARRPDVRVEFAA
jgi:nitrate reductase NapAB chaperone NapD